MKSDGGCACTRANSTPVKRLRHRGRVREREKLSGTAAKDPGALQLLCFICNGHSSVHGLHTKNLVVALFVVEHRRGKVIKHILGGQWSVGL